MDENPSPLGRPRRPIETECCRQRPPQNVALGGSIRRGVRPPRLHGANRPRPTLLADADVPPMPEKLLPEAKLAGARRNAMKRQKRRRRLDLLRFVLETPWLFRHPRPFPDRLSLSHQA